MQGGYPGAGAGNVAGDPHLMRLPNPGADGQWGTYDDDYGDLRPRNDGPGKSSSCIDAGNDAAVPRLVFLDLAGHPRFVDDRLTPDTGVAANNHPVVDIGCYEFQLAGCAADIAPANGGGGSGGSGGGGAGGGDGMVGIDDLLFPPAATAPPTSPHPTAATASSISRICWW